MEFKYYVINYSFNHRKAYMMNIFDNCYVDRHVQIAVKEYLELGEEYKIYSHHNQYIYGYEAFKNEIDSIFAHEFWGRCQYEFVVLELFGDTREGESRVDVYEQLKPNLDIIVEYILNAARTSGEF